MYNFSNKQNTEKNDSLTKLMDSTLASLGIDRARYHGGDL